MEDENGCGAIVSTFARGRKRVEGDMSNERGS